ncbi:hypothetical protein EDC01DRAFT_645662 [Geopyxis carbonaria]|nr:hypothetical protein EDC01DRAFT_645662 [Geopyxis carbonaria]
MLTKPKFSTSSSTNPPISPFRPGPFPPPRPGHRPPSRGPPFPTTRQRSPRQDHPPPSLQHSSNCDLHKPVPNPTSIQRSYKHVSATAINAPTRHLRPFYPFYQAPPKPSSAIPIQKSTPKSEHFPFSERHKAQSNATKWLYHMRMRSDDVGPRDSRKTDIFLCSPSASTAAMPSCQPCKQASI